MKYLLSVTVILFCLHISLISEVTGAEVSRSQISRWKRQETEAPEDFDCSLCGYCKQSCDKTCGLCGGCDLIKALGLNTSALKNYGVDVKECETFCSEGIQGCIKKCKAAEDDCKYCKSSC